MSGRIAPAGAPWGNEKAPNDSLTEGMTADRAQVLWLVPVLLGVFVALALLRSHSYNLFHSVAEFFSVFVALTIFAIAWNTRHIASNSYFAVLGGAYLSVGVIDALHTLAYQGMGVFDGFNTDLPTQLWLSARYLQAAALVMAPLVIGRTVRMKTVLSWNVTVAALLLGAIFLWDVFPVAFVEGQGLTSFKIISEYAISATLAAALGLTLWRRAYFPRPVLLYMTAAIVLTIASELSFTLYTEPTGPANLVGHYLKIAAFYLTYKALVESTLVRPYGLLFRDLKANEEALATSEARYRQIADSLQASLLQVPEALSCVRFGHLYRSATMATRVGGDFYDLFELPDGRTAVLVGDVSGKGLEAATMTALVKDTVRAYAYHGDSPATVMTKTNELLLASTDDSSFVTAFFGLLDLEEGSLTYSSAGHPPALVRRSTGEIEALDEHSPVLAALPELLYTESTTGLREGEVLVLYTDGVVEARHDGEFFGTERLAELVAAPGAASPEVIPRLVFDGVSRFAAGDLRDDIALVAVSPREANC